MIIKVGKIELSEWTNQPQPDVRPYPKSDHWHRLFNTPKNEWKIGVSVKPHPFEDGIWYAVFYHSFKLLNEICVPNFKAANIDIAKDYVDNFLIKMSRLTAFL